MAEAVLERSGTPTRLHLARLLVERGHAADEEQAFRRWLGRGQRAAVPAEWPGLAPTIAAISAAGGQAVLAHPHRLKVSASVLAELCGEFRAAGGAGLEVSLPGMSPGFTKIQGTLLRSFGPREFEQGPGMSPRFRAKDFEH